MTALLITLIALVIFWNYIKVRRERDELKFQVMYMNLQVILDTWPVNKTNYLKIVSYFEDIKKCRWKNTEKVTVLHNAFLEKFERAEFVVSSLEDEDEYSVESVFRK